MSSSLLENESSPLAETPAAPDVSPAPATPDPSTGRSAARAAYSRAGFAGLILALVTISLQMLAMFGLPAAFPGIEEHPVFIWLATFAPLYLIAMPLAALILRKLPAATPTQHKMSIGQLCLAFLMCITMMYLGNLIGTGLSLAFSGGSAQNPLAALVTETTAIQVLVTVFLAPILEELLFRKLLMDRLTRYGTGLAVVASALGFALFHMNLFQFFYAFALGLMFAYIYMRTGLLRYSIILHIAVNFLGTVVGVQVMALGEIALAIYGFVLLACVIAGLVLLIRNRKKFTCPAVPGQLPKGERRVAFLNPGVILYTIVCLAVFVVSLLG